MPDFAINHMSLANASYASLLAWASELGCIGVELRNDLAGSLFDGMSAQNAGAVVHVFDVTNTSVSSADMRDSHRVLVDANDRLGNIQQLDALHAGGYRGVVSFEAFSSAVHELAEPVIALRESISFIESNQVVKAA